MASSTLSSSIIASKSSFAGSRAELKARAKAVAAPKSGTVCSLSENTEVSLPSRRNALHVLAAAAAAVSMNAKPSLAAYGEAANVFGRTGNTSGFQAFSGDGYAVLIPAKFSPSKEREFPGTDMRYESNFRVADVMHVTVNPTDKKNITDYGSPEEFLSTINFMLGTTAAVFVSKSEGGFGENRVALASLLDSDSVTKGDKTYYNLELLCRTADGDEGGRHQLISAVVSDGRLYVCKFQAGDKSWFKGLELPARTAVNSFKVV